jgi:putative transposase
MIDLIDVARQERLPVTPACKAVGLPKTTYYRQARKKTGAFSIKAAFAFQHPAHPRALSPQERENVLQLMHSERFMDMAPAAIHATLLDENCYLCSPRTMYRILATRGEVRERRRQTVHPKRTPPELSATGPNQVWTWDITHLRLTLKGQTVKLYVCLDLYSRYALGWYLSATESAAESRQFFQKLARRESIDPGQLILHGDNGGPMRGQPLADLLESLGIERSHSRPRVSNDNAFSESQFKTMKYRPTYPKYFQSLAEARSWCQEFFAWYNNHHRHEGLAMLTPADVHHGRAQEKLANRANTMKAAFQTSPNRFVKGVPRPKELPASVAINPTTKPQSSLNQHDHARPFH